MGKRSRILNSWYGKLRELEQAQRQPIEDFIFKKASGDLEDLQFLQHAAACPTPSSNLCKLRRYVIHEPVHVI